MKDKLQQLLDEYQQNYNKFTYGHYLDPDNIEDAIKTGLVGCFYLDKAYKPEKRQAIGQDDHSDSIVTSYLIDNQEEPKKQSQIKVHYSQSLSYNRQGVDSNTKQGGNQPFGYDSKVLKKKHHNYAMDKTTRAISNHSQHHG
ncbi:hypothetical protein A9G34_05480 [Gilliamella sp. Choc4-2]|uniref:hypothetical protein n=1 Tax=unclassified Gilliamella TaxID=2685620 RepID=UPI00080DF3C6|nr:hypothetical protein [Gilliamella apicola]OCG33502.1 hypothetical protein A9G33_00650 [Gilliamella apicola]OCG46052.1 hypothetical protein A9G34_05480 [Gilliamella apicola]